MAFNSVKNENKKQLLAEVVNNRLFIKDAAAIVVATGDPEISAKWYEEGHNDSHRTHRSGGDSPGHGTCWIGTFKEATVKSMLKIPKKPKLSLWFQ